MKNHVYSCLLTILFGIVFTVFSNFDEDHLAKIPRLRWKEYLKIKFPEFESETSRERETIASQSREFYRMLRAPTSVYKIWRLCGLFLFFFDKPLSNLAILLFFRLSFQRYQLIFANWSMSKDAMRWSRKGLLAVGLVFRMWCYVSGLWMSWTQHICLYQKPWSCLK